MSYFGTFLLIWLAVGFVISIKRVYVDQDLDKDKLEVFTEQYYKEHGKTSINETAVEFATKKRNFIIMGTLLGFITLFAEFVNLYKKIKLNLYKFYNWLHKK